MFGYQNKDEVRTALQICTRQNLQCKKCLYLVRRILQIFTVKVVFVCLQYKYVLLSLFLFIKKKKKAQAGTLFREL